MSQKKSTTTGNKKSRAELRRELAETLSTILHNPTTPSSLYNAIADAISTLSEDVDFHTPEMIETMLTAYELKEQKRQDKFYEGVSDDEGGAR